MTALAEFREDLQGGRRRAVLSRLIRLPVASFSLAVLALIVLSAILAPIISSSPTAIDPANRLAGPGASHWFGTDELGRDLFSRVLHGGRLALLISGGATVLAVVVGVLWGGTAAVRGGWLDEALMRLVDGTMAIPLLLFALVFISALGASVTNLALIIGILHAPPTARIARAAILGELQSDYCLAARAYGASQPRLLFSEVLPNALPAVLVQATLVAANSLLIEATLSFVGLGVQPPRASWGTLLLQGYGRIHTSYWYVIFPGVMVFASIWALNSLADELQVVLRPRDRS